MFPFDEAGRNEMPHGDTGMLPHGEEGSLSGGSCLSESADSFVLWQDPIGFACEKVRDLCIYNFDSFSCSVVLDLPSI